MSTLFRADDTHATDGRLPANVAPSHVDGGSLYVTNEAFLYRIVGVTSDGAGELVEVEDCYSLDVVLVPIERFRARRLRVVTPSTR